MALTPGEQLKVMSRSDSDIYRVRLEGWADVGNSWGNQHDTSLKAWLHLGRMLSESSELFSQRDFYPQSVNWDWDMGYRNALPVPLHKRHRQANQPIHYKKNQLKHQQKQDNKNRI